jgi:hypothetical protein
MAFVADIHLEVEEIEKIISRLVVDPCLATKVDLEGNVLIGQVPDLSSHRAGVSSCHFLYSLPLMPPLVKLLPRLAFHRLVMLASPWLVYSVAGHCLLVCVKSRILPKDLDHILPAASFSLGDAVLLCDAVMASLAIRGSPRHLLALSCLSPKFDIKRSASSAQCVSCEMLPTPNALGKQLYVYCLGIALSI